MQVRRQKTDKKEKISNRKDDSIKLSEKAKKEKKKRNFEQEENTSCRNIFSSNPMITQAENLGFSPRKSQPIQENLTWPY